MVNLGKTLAAIPDGGGRLAYGTAYWDGAQWWANVGGNNLGARWLDPIVPAQGDKIAVLLSKDGAGQSNAIVLGGYSDQPRPSTGTVSIVGLTEIIVIGSFGGTFTTDRFINPYVPGDLPRSAYKVGDPVYLSWDAAIPTVLGIIGPVDTEAPAPIQPPPVIEPPVPPKPKPQTGTVKGAATRSNTWHPSYGWGNYAGSQNGGQQLYSGTWWGSTVTAAWFYGNAFTSMGSKTVTAIRFRLPARLNVGAPGPATIHLHLHTSKTQPGGDVSRIAGPLDVAVTHRQGARWINLPIGWANTLKAGGGISLSGEPYVGYNGRLKDPESGRIEMGWETT